MRWSGRRRDGSVEIGRGGGRAERGGGSGWGEKCGGGGEAESADEGAGIVVVGCGGWMHGGEGHEVE